MFSIAFYFYFTMVYSFVARLLGIQIDAQVVCTPEQEQFYWKSPCDEDRQSFTNLVTITNLTATQSGVPVDESGGLNSGLDLDIAAVIVDQYGVIKQPLVDIAVYKFGMDRQAGTCGWTKVPTFGMLDDYDACDIVDNCHLRDHPTTLDAAINIKEIAGLLYFGINVDTYYGLSLTFKDGEKPVYCVYAQDKIIKK